MLLMPIIFCLVMSNILSTVLLKPTVQLIGFVIPKNFYDGLTGNAKDSLHSSWRKHTEWQKYLKLSHSKHQKGRGYFSFNGISSV